MSAATPPWTRGTTASPMDDLHSHGHNRPTCPACRTGQLQPYYVEIDLGRRGCAVVGTAWVAVCVGNDPVTAENPTAPPTKPCGFNVKLDRGDLKSKQEIYIQAKLGPGGSL